EVGLRLVGAGRALDAVRGGEANVVYLVRVVRPVLQRVRGVGQPRVRVRRAALEQARGVADRDLHLGDARVERPDHADDRCVGNERVQVRGALLRVVRPVDGVVLDVDVQRVSRDRILRVGLLDGELDAVRGGLTVGRLGAAHRELGADLDRLAAGGA